MHLPSTARPLFYSESPLLWWLQILHSQSCSGVALSYLRLMVSMLQTLQEEADHVDEASDVVIARWAQTLTPRRARRLSHQKLGRPVQSATLRV